MLIGSFSGFMATIVACPLETIKCNIQIDNQIDNQRLKIIDVIKKYKFNGLYNGFFASCGRNIPYYLLFFPFYSRYIDLISCITRRDKTKQNIIDYTLAGGLSGATTWSIIYPLDVIKCNQQIHPEKIKILDMIKIIHKTKGLKGFYVGFMPTLIRSFPANAGLLLGIEITNHLI
jgi:hypothetical protein